MPFCRNFVVIFLNAQMRIEVDGTSDFLCACHRVRSPRGTTTPVAFEVTTTGEGIETILQRTWGYLLPLLLENCFYMGPLKPMLALIIGEVLAGGVDRLL